MSRLRHGCALAALLILTGSAPRPAYAEDDFRVLVERGRAAFALGRYAEAAEIWERTFEMKPQAPLLYNAAQSHRLAGKLERALFLYRNLLRIYGDQVTNRSDIETRIAQLERAVADQKKQQAAPPTTLQGSISPGATPSVTPTPPATSPSPSASREPPGGEPGESREPVDTEPATAPSAAAESSTSEATPSGGMRVLGMSETTVDAEPATETGRKSGLSRTALGVIIGVAAAVVVAAVVIGVVVGTAGPPSPSLGAISF